MGRSGYLNHSHFGSDTRNIHDFSTAGSTRWSLPGDIATRHGLNNWKEIMLTRSRLVPRRAALKVGASTAALPLLAGLLGTTSPAFSQQSPPESEEAKRIVAL